jgi:hypothetical protein
MDEGEAALDLPWSGPLGFMLFSYHNGLYLGKIISGKIRLPNVKITRGRRPLRYAGKSRA